MNNGRFSTLNEVVAAPQFVDTKSIPNELSSQVIRIMCFFFIFSNMSQRWTVPRGAIQQWLILNKTWSYKTFPSAGIFYLNNFQFCPAWSTDRPRLGDAIHQVTHTEQNIFGQDIPESILPESLPVTFPAPIQISLLKYTITVFSTPVLSRRIIPKHANDNPINA